MSRAAAVEATINERRQHLEQVRARLTASETLALAKRADHAAAVEALADPARVRKINQEATEAEAEAQGYADAVTRLQTQIEAMGPELDAARIADADTDAERLTEEAENAVALLGEELGALLRKHFRPHLAKVESKMGLARQAHEQKAYARGRTPATGALSTVWDRKAPGLERLLKPLADYADGAPQREAEQRQAEADRRRLEDQQRAQREAEQHASALAYAKMPVAERNQQALQSLGVQ